jgi:solute carrier family 25 carnitine/acylcarnitine transporter 20/29
LHEGFKGFYKGMGSPLVTIPVVNSIVFASYEFAKRMMGVQIGEECTFSQSLIAGMFGGFMNSFILSPIELVKCRLQVQRESKSNAYYKGPIDCIRKIIVEEGIRNGFFKGLSSTLARETPCYAG